MYKIRVLKLPSDVVDQIHDSMREKNLSLSSLGSLFSEVDQVYNRCAKRSAFEADLPYSEGKYQMFKNIIPAKKFLPPSELHTIKAPEYGQVVIESRQRNFKQVMKRISKQLHLAQPSKVGILKHTNSKL